LGIFSLSKTSVILKNHKASSQVFFDPKKLFFLQKIFFPLNKTKKYAIDRSDLFWGKWGFEVFCANFGSLSFSLSLSLKNTTFSERTHLLQMKSFN